MFIPIAEDIITAQVFATITHTFLCQCNGFVDCCSRSLLFVIYLWGLCLLFNLSPVFSGIEDAESHVADLDIGAGLVPDPGMEWVIGNFNTLQGGYRQRYCPYYGADLP